MITVNINSTTGTTFTGYVRIDEDGGSCQVDGEFGTKLNLADEFAHEFGGNCDAIIVDVTGFNCGTYTFGE